MDREEKVTAESMRALLARTEITFDEESHRYEHKGRSLQGITQTIMKLAYPNTYKKPEGYSEEEWQETLSKAAEYGTRVHKEIQSCCESGKEPFLPEASNWNMAMMMHDIEWIENEYLVTDGKYFASMIDILAIVDGELSIIDIKCTSDIHYDTTALQTTIYKMWFERMNPGLEIKNTYIFWTKKDKWKLEKLPVLPKRSVDNLIKAYINGKKDFEFEISPKWFDRVMQKRLVKLINQRNALDEQIDEIRKTLFPYIEENHYKNFYSNGVSIGYISPTIVETIDKKALLNDHPELYDKYIRRTHKGGHITIKIK